MGLHCFQQLARATEIHVPVTQGLAHRFAHRLEAGEVDHGCDWPAGRGRLEGPLQISSGANVALHHLQPAGCGGAGEFQHALQAFPRAVVEVVQHHQVVARLQQHQTAVGADEASTSGD